MKISKQGDYYKFHLSDRSLLCRRFGGGKRGRITGFSRQSRKRLMRLLASSRWQFGLFITLTSPTDVEFCHVRALIKRLCYKYPRVGKCPIVWRKEFQSRGAVHYHLLVLNCRDYLSVSWLISAWAEIIGCSGSVSVRYVRSRKSVGAYISKYLAKTTIHDREVMDGSRSILDTTHISGDTGRFWGVENRKFLLFFPVVFVSFVSPYVFSRFLALLDYVSSFCYSVSTLGVVWYV